MKKLALLGGAAGIGLFALFSAPIHAADHLDAPAISATANRMADINDVYAWMTSDGSKVNLAMTVSPADDGTRTFGPTIQYVFHVTNHPGFLMPGTETKIICTFVSNTSGQCWVVSSMGAVVDYVSGDLSGSAGRVSASGKFRVFAGRRSDPFFFNLSGFRTAAATVKTATIVGSPTVAGCPAVSAAQAAQLRSELQATPTGATDNGPCAVGEKDCFIDFNVMAIVVQIDKTEVTNGTDKLISVWANTLATP